MDDKRKIVLRVTRDQAQMLEQERRRLRTQYDLKLSISDIVQLLIEHHRSKLQAMASDDKQSVIWFHQYLSEPDEEIDE